MRQILGALCLIFVSGWLSLAGAAEGRVIVLGFDGADSDLTETYMDEGHLPNLAKLRDQGSFLPLATTTPPQTPVSWSSFATGMNPGKNGIFDFLRRDLETYHPDFAMYEIDRKTFLMGDQNRVLFAVALFLLLLLLGLLLGLVFRRPKPLLVLGAIFGVALGGGSYLSGTKFLPEQIPTVQNTRQGDTFWEVAGEAGIRSKIIRVPATYPADPVADGHLLAGLGVPDVRGTTGTFSFYTTDTRANQLGEDTEMGGKIVEVALVNGAAESEIFGPSNRLLKGAGDVKPKVSFSVDRSVDPPTVTVTTQDQTQTFAEGSWSDWYTLELAFTPLVKIYGTCRFYFVASKPFGLYMSAIHFDPHNPPPIPISQPPDFCKTLAERFGEYKTLGWGMDTWALNEERISEKVFLEDVYYTEGKFAEMMTALLDEEDFELFVQVFELTDRVSHMFWRLLDTEHPAYDAALAAEYGDAVLNSYIFMDRMVGEVMKRLKPDDLFLVCSDHGFHTWHKSVNYNTWLVKNGYMTLKNTTPEKKKTLDDLFGQGEFWPNVDWKRTKAYALGLGDLYINVKGRESQGIVEPGEEYDRIRAQLITDLKAFVDEETGDHPVRNVYKREDIYNGYDEDLIPDLFVANNAKYRVSWQTSLGGIPKGLFEINAKKWSGDHCSLDPEITKGIFFSNQPVQTEDVSILDFYPTILKYLGLPASDNIDGKPLSYGSE